MQKGKKMTLKSRQKLSQSIKGHSVSEETRKKISQKLKGRKWTKKERENHKKRMTPELKSKLRLILLKTTGSKGYKWTPEQRAKLSKSTIGREIKEEARLKISEKIKGENHYNWKGGVTSVNQIIRRSLKYRRWRSKVFERDNFTCTECNETGGYLQAHHIKSFAKYPNLRFLISNGITVCKKCHAKIDKHYARFTKTS